ncbi:hypothetical protein MHYP_G00049710 [Metynnis hypsauchen]
MASISVDQDQFSCPICLDLLKDPVAIPCGHSFCKVCINGHWDRGGVYSCPQCRETFTPRPVLRRNNMLAEVVEKLKKTELQAASPAHCYAGPGDVECDFCTGRKRKAIKSCLACVASLCEVHLKPHLEIPALIKHKLVTASSKLQEKICPQHDKLIEIFCRTDQQFVCYLCTMDEHMGHSTAAAVAERKEKQNELKEMQRKFQQKLQENLKKLQEVKQAVKTLKSSAQAAVEDSERIFTELIRSMEKKRSEVTELIRAQEEAELRGAEELLEQLEQEIADLKRRDTELEQLKHTEDHIQFLQSFQSLCVSSGSDCSSIDVNQRLSFDGVRKSLSDLKERLEEFCSQEFRKISPHVSAVHMILPSEPKTREDFLQYFCHLTLDPNTGHDTVAAVEERSEKQNELKEVQRKFQQSLQEKEKKLQEVKQAVKTLKSSAQAAVEDSERIFTELIRSIEKKRSEVTDLIRAQEEAELSGAEELLEQLEQDIADLKRRDTELEQLSRTDDHIQFLQSFQSLCVSSGSDRSPIYISQHPSCDRMRKSLSDLKERLEEFCKQEFRKISPQVAAVQMILPSEPKTREDFLHYFCRLTLDPNTVNQKLSLSEKNRVVMFSGRDQRYSDHPERFDYWHQVLTAAERTQKQFQLMAMQRRSQQRLQEKEKMLQEVKQAVKTLKSSAQAAVEDSERIFTELIRSIEKKRSEVTELIRAQEKAELSGAEELLEQLEQEIADLKRRDTELEQLSHTEDHIQFLQSFQSLCVSSGSEDSSSITVHQCLSFDGVRKSLSDLKERLEEFCKQEFSKISPHAAVVQTLPSEPKTREDYLQSVQIISPSEPKTRGFLQCGDTQLKREHEIPSSSGIAPGTAYISCSSSDDFTLRAKNQRRFSTVFP